MPNKKYTVTVSDKAVSMLVNHIQFLTRVSPVAAKKLHKEIINEIKTLEYMPESYPFLNRNELPANKYRKKLAAKRYLLVYQIKGNNVYVDCIVDCRQEYNWLP